MENVLDSIDDQRAVEILTRVVKGRGLLACAPGLDIRQAQAALAEAFGQAGSGDTPTGADLARQCLRLLSQNPDTAQAIAAMAGQPDRGAEGHMGSAPVQSGQGRLVVALPVSRRKNRVFSCG